MANYLAPEDDPVNFLPGRVNPNLAAQGRRYNLTERQQINPLMQAGAEQWVKEFASMKNRGAVPDLINRGLIANTAGLPVDLVNTVLQSLGLGSEQPVGGSDSIRRALEYYGLSSETQRPMLETLASLTPPRAVMGAARVAGQGAEALGRAAAPVAGQALENYMVRTGDILPMDVYHGSPHRFPPTAKNPLGEFDASKIGTGEGAQSYGHGLYFAEKPDVAVGYQEKLGKSLFNALNEAENKNLPKQVSEYINKHGMSAIDEQLAIERGALPTTKPGQIRTIRENMITSLEKLKSSGDTSFQKGSLYKVDLPDEHIAKMLDWDKPIGQQPFFMEAIKNTGFKSADPKITGHEFMRDWLAGGSMSNPEATATLKTLGIPGIRYLDGGSRAGGQGTSNFVVFDPKHMNIIGRE